MVISSHGFVQVKGDITAATAEWQLFTDNLTLIFDHEHEILNCSEYFFCQLSFAYCSWPYINGDGPLALGQLIIGWQNGILAEPCPDCRGVVYLVSFAGSPLSGSNWWRGICSSCRLTSRDTSKGTAFHDRLKFVLHMRKQFPAELSEWEEYDGHVFSWGGNGLRPARKKRKIIRQLADPVSFEVLISELKSGELRTGTAPNVSLLQKQSTIKLSDDRGNSLIPQPR